MVKIFSGLYSSTEMDECAHSPSRAVVVTDFPIVAAAAARTFGSRYRVISETWEQFAGQVPRRAAVGVIDATDIPADTVLKLGSRALPGARLILFSLHRNEVALYRATAGGPVLEREFAELALAV